MTWISILRRRIFLSLAKVIQIAIDCAEGLEYAHSQKVAHRDIKPSNIMYDPETGVVKSLILVLRESQIQVKSEPAQS